MLWLLWTCNQRHIIGTESHYDQEYISAIVQDWIPFHCIATVASTLLANLMHPKEIEEILCVSRDKLACSINGILKNYVNFETSQVSP